MINIAEIMKHADEVPVQVLLGDLDKIELEEVCRSTQRFMSELLRPFAARHPELFLSVEPKIHIQMAP